MAEGFDSLTNRPLHVQIYDVPSQLTLFWEEFSAFEQVFVISPLLWMFVLLLNACMRITASVITLALPYIVHGLLRLFTKRSEWLKRLLYGFFYIMTTWVISIVAFIYGEILGVLVFEDGVRRATSAVGNLSSKRCNL